MDSREFAQDFLAAFDAHVTFLSTSEDAMPEFGIGIGYPMGYTVNVTCHMPTVASAGDLIRYFDLCSYEHRLIKVYTTASADHPMGLAANQIDLTYRSTDFDKFLLSLKDLAYERYSKKFHQQLEDILD